MNTITVYDDDITFENFNNIAFSILFYNSFVDMVCLRSIDSDHLITFLMREDIYN